MVIRTGVAPLRPYKWVGRVVWNAGAPNSSGGFGGHWLIIMPDRTMTCQAHIKHQWSINQKKAEFTILDFPFSPIHSRLSALPKGI